LRDSSPSRRRWRLDRQEQVWLAADGCIRAAGSGMLPARNPPMADEPIEQVRERFRQARARTAEREARLGEDEFLSLPQRMQNQLAVLQAQCEEPVDDNREAIIAAEHNLRNYNAKLEQALNLSAQLGGARRRQVSDRRRGMLKTVILLGVLGALAGGGWLVYGNVRERKAELCRSGESCKTDGRCSAGLRVELPAVELVCQATSDEDCRQSQRCREGGQCFVSLGRCIAKQDEDCRKAPGCKQDGLCTAQNGRCVATAREDCRTTPGCQERGQCSPQQGICAVLSDDDCQHSLACKQHGACTEVQGQCVKLEE
jgi:hypothetical protein